MLDCLTLTLYLSTSPPGVLTSTWFYHVYSPGATLLETKAMELMPNESNVRSVSEVCMGLAGLGRSSLAAFVSSSSRGSFDAAAAMMNQIERDLPLKMDEISGIQLGKQTHQSMVSTASYVC